jgi:ParB family chromosome partitioning protein
MPQGLRRADLVARDGEEVAEGQGDDALQRGEVDLPAFLTADLPVRVASMMAAEWSELSEGGAIRPRPI